MNRKRFLLLLPAAAIAGVVFAQGPLTPPGAPAPAMKSLDQIEPRKPISALPFTIGQPGSYYLTKNLGFSATSGDAITIAVENVTLDLMGFTLSSTSGVLGYAIRIESGLRNIVVKNGVIEGNTTVTVSGTAPNQAWTVNGGGFFSGIIATVGTEAKGCHFSQLRISGCRSYGLDGGELALIDHVTASQNGSGGIKATSGSIAHSGAGFNGGQGGTSGIYLSSGSVSNCTAESNGSHGITADSVVNCTVDSNGSHGISVFDGRVINSGGHRNGSNGIQATNSSVTNCTAGSNGIHGIFANSGSVTNCTARLNGVDGIAVSSGVIAFCKSSGNNVNNGSGVDIDGSGSTRTGNHPAP